MKPCQLCYQFTDDHVQLSVARGEDILPVGAWRTYEVRNKTGALFSCAMLEQFCNKGWATLTEDTVTVLNRHMAKCQPWELAALALPPALPYQMKGIFPPYLTSGALSHPVIRCRVPASSRPSFPLSIKHKKQPRFCVSFDTHRG